MAVLETREVKGLTQDPTDTKWRSWDDNYKEKVLRRSSGRRLAGGARQGVLEGVRWGGCSP